MKPEETIVGFIGLGVMGRSMAGHILDAGYGLHVYTRTKKTARELMEKGAVWHDTAAALSRQCDVIITIVGFPEDVEEIYLGPGGLIENSRPGTILVDMTTSRPGLAESLFETGREKGIDILDAPVSGGDIGARNAALSIMVGGRRAVFDKVAPLFEVMGKNIVFQGNAGAGQHTKVVNQMAIAAGMVAVCEALSYARKAGLDPQAVLESIGPGAAGSWSLNTLGPRMLNDDFEPGFYIKHFIKDMEIAKESSKDLNLDCPGLSLALSLYRKLDRLGLSDNGTQALFKLFQ